MSVKLTEENLKKVGVQLVDKHRVALTCMKCGESWAPANPKAELPPGWWKCPKGCNADARKPAKAPAVPATAEELALQARLKVPGSKKHEGKHGGGNAFRKQLKREDRRTEAAMRRQA